MKNHLRIFAIIALSLFQISMAKADGKSTTDKVKVLNVAAETGDKMKLKKLLKEKNLEINGQDEAGMTPLMSAALGGQVDVIKQLLAHKAKLEVKNTAGDTALAVAVTNDQFDAARVLIHAGANVDLIVAGDEGDTLFIRAANNDLKTAELILKKNKAVLNKTNKLGENALMKSVRFGNNDSVKMLLAAGADKKAKNQAGLSALEIAKQSHNDEAARLLSK
jgi:ankyrin repeat protein